MNDTKQDEGVGIPEFLKRSEPKPADPVKSEVKVMSDQVEEVGPDEAPAKAKPRKVKAKANGASKPAKAAKAAPAKVKATSKPAKAKAATAKAKAKGAKPKAKRESKVVKDEFGFREGTIKSQAAAMYASKNGATLGEVKDELGSIQLNLLTKLESEGYKVTKLKEEGDGPRKVTRYFLRAK